MVSVKWLKPLSFSNSLLRFFYLSIFEIGSNHVSLNQENNIEEQESPEKTMPVPQPNAHPLAEQNLNANMDEQQMYNMEQQQYYEQQMYGEEGEGQEITGALVATRMNRKKAADDAKLLANRIALLKLEEKKAWKKIQETKKKAE